MAIRVFECKECDHQQEVLTDSKDEPRDELKCEECEGTDLEKSTTIAKTSFALTGGGWFNSGGY